jgi:hypothetical protein
MDAYLSQRKDFEGVNSTRLFSDHQLDSLSKIAGFADRNWALGQLTYNENGTRDLDTYLAISFIGYLFILFECLPVFVKLMSPKGPYDVAIAKTHEANVYYAERDKERDIEVIDSVYKDHVDEDIKRRRNTLSNRTGQDRDRHRYD